MAEPTGDDVLVVPPMPLATGQLLEPEATARRSGSPSSSSSSPPRTAASCASRWSTATAPGGRPDPSPARVVSSPNARRFTLTRWGENRVAGFQRTPSARRYEVERSAASAAGAGHDDDETAGGRCSACITHVRPPVPPGPQRPRGAGPARGPGAAPGAGRRPDPHARAGRGAARRHGRGHRCRRPHRSRRPRPRGGPRPRARSAGRPATRRPATREAPSRADKRPRRPDAAEPAPAGPDPPRRGRHEHPAAPGGRRPGRCRAPTTAGTAGGAHDATSLALTAQTSLLQQAGRYRQLEQEVAQRQTELQQARDAEQAARAQVDGAAGRRRRRPPPTSTAPAPTERLPDARPERARRRRDSDALYRQALADRADRAARGCGRPCRADRRRPGRGHRAGSTGAEAAVDARRRARRRRPGHGAGRGRRTSAPR